MSLLEDEIHHLTNLIGRHGWMLCFVLCAIGQRLDCLLQHAVAVWSAFGEETLSIGNLRILK